MTFWTTGLEPVSKYRFKVQFAGVGGETGDWWWAKAVTKPSYDINASEYQLINHKFKYPGVLTWQDITITMYDVGAKASGLMKYLGDIGYNNPLSDGSGIQKKQEVGDCTIKQLDSSGAIIENWVLSNCVIKTINFGDLDYSDDEFVELQLTIMYDWATLSGGKLVASGGTKSNVAIPENTKKD